MAITSLNNLGIPTTNAAGSTQVLLMPKLKYRFRVTLLGFGVAAATELTKQVQDVTRPKVSFEEYLDIRCGRVVKKKKLHPSEMGELRADYLALPPHRQTTKHIPSLNSGIGVATKREVTYYTGENMLGIGQLHKSNSVPVFRQQDAEDQAKMRRG